MSEPLRITVFDYGAGNMHSLVKSLEQEGTVIRVESDATQLVAGTDALVLPGVGAFARAAERIAPARNEVANALRGGLPTLGICLGMQLLFDESDEGEGAGLGVLEGRVTRLTSSTVPQIGWNSLDWESQELAPELDMAYYANSYVARPTNVAIGNVLAWSEHEGDRFPAVVLRGETLGTQFHPEKSSAAGVHFIQQFLDRARAARARNTLSGGIP